MRYIESKENPEIKKLKRLAEKSAREKEGLFVIEGERLVFDAIKNGAEIESVYLDEDFKLDKDLGAKVFKLSKKLFKSVSQTQTPQGIMAAVKIKKAAFSDLKIKDKSLVVVCENLQDPGNLGTIIRTADSAGACGVILTKGCVDLYNPKVVRSTMSSIFNLPIVFSKTIDESISYLKKVGFLVIGGHLSEKTQDFYSLNLRQKCAFIIGNEGAGLSDTAAGLCDKLVKIPMLGKAESLNAAVSAAIFMYEHVRQNYKNRSTK